jgi:hypothetical protein
MEQRRLHEKKIEFHHFYTFGVSIYETWNSKYSSYSLLKVVSVEYNNKINVSFKCDESLSEKRKEKNICVLFLGSRDKLVQRVVIR